MSVTHLPKWDITAIEIALDLEPPLLSDPFRVAFSGAAEPRICLVTSFALTAQLTRILNAIDRVVPARLPAGLRIAPARGRAADTTAPGAVAIQPMLSLLRLQRRLIRAIEPGLADRPAAGPAGEMDEAPGNFIRDFIPSKTLPTFEPALPIAEFEPMRLRPSGITIYRVGNRGMPESILAHWAYARSARGSLHLRSGP